VAVTSFAVPAIEADRHWSVDRRAAPDARLVAVSSIALCCVARLSQITTSPADQRQRTVFSSRVT